MTDFIFAYHGGKMPDTPEEGAKVMEQWGAWMEKTGEAMVIPGNPAGMSRTVSSSGVANDGGPNPISGFSVVRADNIEAAIEIARSCPHLTHEGTIEVAELLEM